MATKKKTKTIKRPAKVKAKPATKKKTIKKKTIKKKTTKSVVNPHAGKRFFKIEFSGYGGELIVGQASEEFVKYWLHEDRKDLLTDHIHAMHDKASFLESEAESYDENSPEIYKGAGIQEYWNFDDIEHETMVSYEYSPYTVTEIKVDPKAEYVDGELSWNDKETRKKSFDWSANMFEDIEGTTKEYSYDNCIVHRELYVHDTKTDVVDPVPVLMMYDSQKGMFGTAFVMTNGEDFDPKKFAYVAFDNTMSSNAEMFFYDKQMLSVDNSWLNTWGKGFYSSVGYVPKGEIEYNFDEMLKEGWKNLENT